MFVKIGQVSTQDSTLVLPALTVGNIGQLAIDLAVSSLNIPRVGFFDSPVVVPLCGNDVFSRNHGTLTTALELFYTSELKALLLQQRAPILRGKANQFALSLMDLIKKEGTKDVLLISSLHSAILSLSQALQRPIVRVLCNYEEDKELFASVGCLPLENEYLNDVLTPGTVTERLYTHCKKEGVALTVLITFCAEGDNLPEATHVAEILYKFLNAKKGNHNATSVQWQSPSSWSVLFSGSPFDQNLFQ